jgi:hypothetical protein
MHTETASAQTATIDPTRRYLCRHVFTDGHRCGSPSLRGQDLCYYHTRTRREGACAGRTGTFTLARIDDRPAVQIALYDVLSRLAGGDIDYKRGSILLYGLQIASSNLGRNPQPVANQPPQVEEITSDYHLGDLAPITEIPEPVPEPAAAAGPVSTPQEPAILSPAAVILSPDTAIPSPGANIVPSEAVILSAAKDPCISPATPPNPPFNHKALIPPQSTAEADQPGQEASPTPSAIAAPLPTRDATGRLYPPPHKLDPPNTGRIPRPRTGKTQTANPAPITPNSNPSPEGLECTQIYNPDPAACEPHNSTLVAA